MPDNKNAFYRYRIIDRCLRDTRKKWSIKDIFNEVNKSVEASFGEDSKVSPRTIPRDIDAINYHMIEAGARPVEIEKYRVDSKFYYRYSDPEFSLFNLPLSPMDNARLTKALEVLRSIQGLEIGEEVHSIIEYLQSRTALRSDSGRKVIHFDMQPGSAGNEHIEKILVHIQEKKPLLLHYKRYTKNKTVVHRFHPYLLKEYNKAWFCTGYCSTCKQVINIGLDRIQGKLTELKQPYIENSFFDPDTYFNDIVGVTHPAKVSKQKIIFEISAERYPYLRNNPVHQSQKIIKTKANGQVIMSVEVIPNKELLAVLLSFGDDLIIRQPDYLVQKAKDKLFRATSLYS